MYGMTEAFPIAFKAVSEDGVPGTSGGPNAAFDVRIVDGDGTSAARGRGRRDRLPANVSPRDERRLRRCRRGRLAAGG